MGKLQISDIIIFEAHDLLGYTIAALTDSTVSHAAIVNNNLKPSIAEMDVQGIVNSKINISFQKKLNYNKAYIMRYVDPMDLNKPANVANKYLEETVKYDFPALVLLAGILIYKELKTDNWESIKLIIRMAIYELDKIIGKLINKQKKFMVCSQLVYQCYLDSGYDLEIENGSFQNNSSYRLCDLVEENSLKTIQEPELKTTEKLINKTTKELYNSLKTNVYSNSLPTIEVKQYVNEFIKKIEKILELTQSNQPIESLFITPADLLNKSNKLEQESVLWVNRN